MWKFEYDVIQFFVVLQVAKRILFDVSHTILKAPHFK